MKSLVALFDYLAVVVVQDALDALVTVDEYPNNPVNIVHSFLQKNELFRQDASPVCLPNPCCTHYQLLEGHLDSDSMRKSMPS